MIKSDIVYFVKSLGIIDSSNNIDLAHSGNTIELHKFTKDNGSAGDINLISGTNIFYDIETYNYNTYLTFNKIT